MLNPISSRKLTETPSSVVDLDDAKRHLGIYEDNQFDDLITELIASASEYVGDYIGQPIGSVDVEFYYMAFNQRLVIPYKRIDDIESVEYYNESRVLTEVDSADYFLDDTARDNLVVFPTVPTDTLSEHHTAPVKVTIATNLFTDTDSAAIQQALMFIIADWFKYRENTTIDSTNRIPVGAHRLLSSYRRQNV